MTAFDHRREFRGIPDFLSDGDGICGNVSNLGTDVFAKDTRQNEVESFEQHQITAYPSRSFAGLLSKCGAIARELGLFSLFDGES